MNNSFKYLIGSAIGGGIGWFVGAVIVEMLIIKEYREDYGDESPIGENDIPVAETEEGNLFKRPTNMSKQKMKNYDKLFEGSPEIEQLAKKYRGELDETSGPEEEIEVDLTSILEDESGDIQPISVISEEEYANTESLEAVTLYFYDDDVVTDEHGVPIEHVEQLIGDEALVSFGELSDDPDIVYVRNLPKKALYEIVRKNMNYAAPVNGRRYLAEKMRRRDRIDKMSDEEMTDEPGKKTTDA